ncbi:MAG TPA: ATP-dependent zinc metalloprotease FtsH [Mycobacteriales bacterium]|nr:ATP-dependent zinc metalloprotease FtsH [Mycobacteriales bacterium]
MDNEPTKSPPAPPKLSRRAKYLLWLAALLLVGLDLAVTLSARSTSTRLTYSTFLARADAGQVKSVQIESNGSASGKLTNGQGFVTTVPVGLAGPQLVRELRDDGVQLTATAASSSSWWSGLFGFLLVLAPIGILFWLMRGGLRRGGLVGAAGMTKAHAKVFDAEHPRATFDDVAGYAGVKAEVSEIVDFLRQPDRYRRAGAVAPRGILMLGPPGTGKTLIARAVAGEAGVAFFSVTGSSFVEMFVGVGAARVRDLFEVARKSAPSIIFVDEIDAIGQRRSGSGVMVSNDEREQTLNQLLAEMDGFDPADGVVVLAATNRPEVLDLALVRPGRFDRQITVPLPNQADRLAILQVHCKSKTLDEDVDLGVIARATPGFSGADLANLANEAAIAAARDNRTRLSGEDFVAARDRITLGRRDGSNVLLADEKLAVATHESGHALVAALLPHADPVDKVTILPAGQTLGVTQQLPVAERHLYSESYLRDALAVRLGGRAAELVALGEASTGAANDLEQATDLAIKMVREFGLSPKLGPVGYPAGGSVFLGDSTHPLSSRPFAEQTQAAVDDEVARLLREAEQTAIDLLQAHREQLSSLTDLLMERETVDGGVISDLLRPAPVPSSDLVDAPHDQRERDEQLQDRSR